MALTDNLVSYWKLDEGSGNAADSVGSNTLTNNGSMAYGAAKINNGANIGSGQYLSIADASQTGLDFSDALTFAGWIYFNGAISTLEPYIAKRVATSNQRSFIFYTPDTGNQLGFEWNSDGTTGTSAAVSWTPSTTTWYHIAITKSGTTVKFYVNGSQQGTDQTGAFSTIYNGTAQFEVGYWNTTADFLNGIMDEWGVWSRALDASEISQLYNSGTGLQYPFSTGTSIKSLALLGVG